MLIATMAIYMQEIYIESSNNIITVVVYCFKLY